MFFLCSINGAGKNFRLSDFMCFLWQPHTAFRHFFLKLIFIVFVLKWCKWNKPTCLLLQSNELWFCLVISLTFSNVYEWINRNGISKKTLLLDETNKVKGMYQKLRGPKLNQILTQNMFDCMSCAQLTTDQILIIFRLMIKNF